MKMVNSIDYLGKKVTLKIDRPLGTRHPQHGFIYMLNYGYVPDTISGDDEELDAYLIGEFELVLIKSDTCLLLLDKCIYCIKLMLF